MIYLIIPVICFVLFASFFWALLSSAAREKVRRGKIDDLDPVLSVLMTAGLGEPSLVMKVPKRVTWVKLTFPGSAVRLELPLITHRQKGRKDSYLATLQELDLNTRILSNGDGQEIIECEIEGPSTRVSAIVKDAFVRLFEVDPGKNLEFQIFAHFSDQAVIDQALKGTHSGIKKGLPKAGTAKINVESQKEKRAGCMKDLAGVFLLPLLFMIAYLEQGYIAASFVLVAIVVVRETSRLWRKSKPASHLSYALRITTLSLAGATIYFANPFYLQLVPTALLGIVAVTEFLAASLNLPRLSTFDRKGPEYTRKMRVFLSFAVVATCLMGIATNEYLRSNVTLDAWVWFFAFARIELILGLLVSTFPLIFFMEETAPRTKGDGDSQ